MTDLELYRVLIAVGDSNNLREAATKLGFSQPAISMKLRILESGQPVPLFYMEGKKKVLTHFGRRLYETAKEEVRKLEEGILSVQRLYQSPQNLHLRIGSRPEFLEIISERIKFPGSLEFVNLSAKDSVESLLAHEVEIAISHIVPDSSEIIAKKILSSRAQIVVPKALLKGRSLNLRLAKDLDFLVETPSVQYSKAHLLSDWYRACGGEKKLRAKYTVGDWQLVRKLVEAGKGYSIVPTYIELPASIVKLELHTSVLPEFTFYALYEKNLAKVPGLKDVLSQMVG